MLCFLERREGFAHFKSQISDLKAIAESCSKQLRGWADHLQNSDIRGQRHLNEKTRSSYRSKGDAEEFQKEILAMLPPDHPLRKAEKQGTIFRLLLFNFVFGYIHYFADDGGSGFARVHQFLAAIFIGPFHPHAQLYIKNSLGFGQAAGAGIAAKTGFCRGHGAVLHTENGQPVTHGLQSKNLLAQAPSIPLVVRPGNKPLLSYFKGISRF
jgi:hypothetical protein